MVGLIDSRSVDIYKMMKAQKHVGTTPISADAWTAHLEQQFRQPVENDFRIHARLPTRHQALSNQLCSRLILPSDLAVSPGPGGRYRQDAVVNPPLNNLQLPPPATHYELSSVEYLISYVQQNVSRMNMYSSPGFDPFATPFIKKSERHYRDGRDKLRKENVLLFTLTDLFHLLLSSVVLPQPWFKTKITPLHKKGALSDPKHYHMLAINGCNYRLFSNVVRDLLTEWALAEHQISDTQFGFCITRNTNQPLFIIQHVLTCDKKSRRRCTRLLLICLLPTTTFKDLGYEITYKHWDSSTPSANRDGYVSRRCVYPHWRWQDFWRGGAWQRFKIRLPSEYHFILAVYKWLG